MILIFIKAYLVSISACKLNFPQEWMKLERDIIWIRVVHKSFSLIAPKNNPNSLSLFWISF